MPWSRTWSWSTRAPRWPCRRSSSARRTPFRSRWRPWTRPTTRSMAPSSSRSATSRCSATTRWQSLMAAHESAGNAVTVLTAVVPDPTGYGRILRDDTRRVARQRRAPRRHRRSSSRSTRSTAGSTRSTPTCCRDALGGVGEHNAQGERYLPDVLAVARTAGQPRRRGRRWPTTTRCSASTTGCSWPRLRRLMCDAHARDLDAGRGHGRRPGDDLGRRGRHARAGRRALPGRAASRARRASARAPGSGRRRTLRDTVVGEGATVVRSHLVGCPGRRWRRGRAVRLPAAGRRRSGRRARPARSSRSRRRPSGRGAKVPHLTYVGDADIGDGTNIGASSVFVNYDGVTKHRTVVGDHCRTGSDTMFIAPVTIGDGAYTAAGSVITQDVPPGRDGGRPGQAAQRRGLGAASPGRDTGGRGRCAGA